MSTGWGSWEEERRYPSKDGTHMVIVSKRTQRYGDEEKVFWKNRRCKLTPGGLGQEGAAESSDRASLET